MSDVPLKRLAELRVDRVRMKPGPLLTLDVVESGTGRLLAREWPEPELPPEAGVVDAEQGDVLFGKLRPYLAKVLVVEEPSYASTELMCLRPLDGVESCWLQYVLLSQPLIEWSIATSEGTKMPRTSWERLATFGVPSANPKEQRAIADFLDAETFRIDALIAKKRRLLDLIGERSRQRQIDTACGRNLGMVTMDSGSDWLGRIPAHWRVKRLKYTARLESGHTPSRTKPELWENCNTPWVTLNDVGYLEAHEFVEETLNLISRDGLAASSARVLPTGTVVLSRDATVGRCGILARPMATSQHFVNWICSPELRPRYLWLLFRTAMQPYFDSLTSGATLRTIGMPDVKALKVPVPPLREQDEIVAEAGRVRLQANRAMILLQNQLAFLQERRQALITAAVTGELDLPGLAA